MTTTPLSTPLLGAVFITPSLSPSMSLDVRSTPASIPITITEPNAFYSVQNVICNGGNIITSNASDGLEAFNLSNGLSIVIANFSD